jgi:hypothetical protein
MKLTASWINGRDASADMPDLIMWEDGRTGTLEDLCAHNRDTYSLTHPEDGTTQIDVFPEIVAEVSYCEFGGCWGIKGYGVETAALQLTDQNATDQQIHSALHSLPMKYRAVIHRKPIQVSQ